MEIASGFMGTGHGCSFLDIKRYPKGSELDTGSMGDFFGIDDLFDFSNEDIGAPIGEACHTGGSSAPAFGETVSCKSLADGKSSQLLGVLEANGPGDICVPCDDLAELEWLSNFVEESFSSADATTTVFSSGFNTNHGEHNHLLTGKQQFGSSSPISVLESSACSASKLGSFNPEIIVPGRARSKRSRSGVCFWNTRILSAADTSASLLESSSTSTITATAPLSPDLDTFAYDQGGADSSPTKKVKNNQGKAKKGQDAAQARRCLHCGIQRTPQWRTGPMGPKTLCNACGVRYKSGRLLPEYRPAASPTFVESIHSNSHRKVLELRRQRDFEFDIQQAQFVEEEEEEQQEQQEVVEAERGWGDGCLLGGGEFTC